MSHHGQDGATPQPSISEFLKLGPTNEFPKGKLNEQDEGEIRIAIAADTKNKKVIIDFGKSVKWIGFDPEQALDVAKSLIEKAGEALTKEQA